MCNFIKVLHSDPCESSMYAKTLKYFSVFVNLLLENADIIWQDKFELLCLLKIKHNKQLKHILDQFMCINSQSLEIFPLVFYVYTIPS